MTAPANITAIERSTSRPWEQWVRRLDELGAAELAHRDIAPHVQRELDSLGVANAGWWAQSVTVAYEQHIGRRVPGQQSDGTFSAAASRTVDGSPDDALAAWTALIGGRTRLADRDLAGDPTTSTTPKWRYWRCTLDDGTRVEVTIGESGPGRSRIAVAHNRLPSPDSVDDAKAFWKSLLAEL
ncbi:hypothetical protein [Rhodococcus sp. O3]|uniref:hypothetical protein n=1 Tax=Rhodococcus sp. O3 TaxID=3404919 RepID=UPI003B674FEE